MSPAIFICKSNKTWCPIFELATIHKGILQQVNSLAKLCHNKHTVLPDKSASYSMRVST